MFVQDAGGVNDCMKLALQGFSAGRHAACTGVHACPCRHGPCGSIGRIGQQNSSLLCCACAVWLPWHRSQLHCASAA